VQQTIQEMELKVLLGMLPAAVSRDMWSSPATTAAASFAHVQMADGWCWFVLREEYCWLVAAGCWWLVLSERKVLLAGG
jgi:hypothetical protein